MRDLNIFLAFSAGLVSFVSPCVLPLVPSYVSFIGGNGLKELKEGKVSRVFLMFKTVFFVLGFSVVFVLMGVLFSGTAAVFSGVIRWINIFAGLVVIIFGLNLVFNFLRFLNYEKRFHFSNMPRGAGGAMLLGMAFAAGWSPCIGPILASILALAASSAKLHAGILLLSVYSLGLAMPFLLTSLFLSKTEGIMEKIKPHMLTIQRVSGLVLLVIGVLMLLGQYQQATNWFFLASFKLQEWYEENPIPLQILFALVFLLLAFVVIRPVIVQRKPLFSVPIRAILFSLLLLIAILQLVGILELPVLLAVWLGFQGI